MNIVFAGTPEFAKALLCSLLTYQKNHPDITLQAVFTQPDRAKGRGQQVLACPTKQLALSADLPVYQYPNLNTPEQKALVLSHLPWHQIDLLITAAYGLILPPYLLALPKYGCWNVHASLLPRWRGASPIQQAILAGDTESGISLIQMAEGLDDGDILWQEACAIAPKDTYASLEQKLAHLGASLLSRALTAFKQNPSYLPALKQNTQFVTLAPKISKASGHLNWALPALQLERTLRAFSPAPGCFTLYENQRIKIWGGTCFGPSLQKNMPSQPPGTILACSPEGLSIQAGENTVFTLTQLQLPGKNKSPFSQILNGHPHFFKLNTQLN